MDDLGVALFQDTPISFGAMFEDFTRTTVFSRPMFQNKANVYLSADPCYDSEGHGSNLPAVFNWKSVKGYESDPWSTTQVETSLVEGSLVGVGKGVGKA